MAPKNFSLWVFYLHSAQGVHQHVQSYTKLSLITLNRLVLVLGKLSRRLAAFMVAAPASPSPLRQGLTRPLPCGETTQQQCFTDSLTLHPRQFEPSNWLGQLVCWWFWARSATLLCFGYFGPAWLQRQGAVALLRCLVSTRLPRSVTLPRSRLSLFSSFKTTMFCFKWLVVGIQCFFFSSLNNIHNRLLQQELFALSSATKSPQLQFAF